LKVCAALPHEKTVDNRYTTMVGSPKKEPIFMSIANFDITVTFIRKDGKRVEVCASSKQPGYAWACVEGEARSEHLHLNPHKDTLEQILSLADVLV
jgi:hypothetical protein